MNILLIISGLAVACWLLARFWTAWECLRCGRRICAWCERDMGPAATLARGETTHGICPACKTRHFPEDVKP